MASESKGEAGDREQGHKNHFALLAEGHSWSGREPNTLFQNRGDGTFEEVGNVLGLYLRLDSRGAAVADLDSDGDLDLVVYNRNNPTLKIYRNDTPGQGNALQVDLVGKTHEAGAQVVAHCGGKSFLRQVVYGGGFISQNPPRLHFGLGGCTEVDALDIRWPSGHQDRIEDLPVNHRVVFIEGDFKVQEAIPLERRNYNRDQGTAPIGDLSAPVPAVALRPLGESQTFNLAAENKDLMVLNFWATWCTGCLVEIPELEALHREYQDRGVRFMGINLDEEKSDAEIKAFLEERGITYQQTVGDMHEQGPFWSLASAIPGAIPLTVVVQEGTVRAVFSGRVDVHDLREMLDSYLN